MISNNSILLGNRVIKQLVRDKRTFGMVVVVPIIITLIFGLAIAGEIENVPVIIIMEDTNEILTIPVGHPMNPSPSAINISIDSIGASIQEFLDSDVRTKVVVKTNLADAMEDVDQEKITGVIHLPENLTKNFLSSLLGAESEDITVDLYLDGTRPTLVQGIISALQDAINSTMADISDSINQDFAFIKLSNTYSNDLDDLTAFDVTIPGVIALILNFLIILIGTLMLVRETTYKTKSRLLSTPIKPYEVVLGYMIGLMFLAIMMCTSVVSISVFLFNAKVVGDMVQLYIVILLFGSIFVFMGVFLSNFARNELQAIQFGPFISFPSMALCGFLVPIEILPTWLQPVAYLLPMTYGIKVFRGIMLKGYSIIDVLPDFMILVGFALVFLVLAVLTIKSTVE